MAKRVVLAGGAFALVAVLAVTLSSRTVRRSGTDMTPNQSFAAVLAAGQEACQGQELLPADTAAVQLTIGTYGPPGPAIDFEVKSASGTPLARGGLRAGW